MAAMRVPLGIPRPLAVPAISLAVLIGCGDDSATSSGAGGGGGTGSGAGAGGGGGDACVKTVDRFAAVIDAWDGATHGDCAADADVLLEGAIHSDEKGATKRFELDGCVAGGCNPMISAVTVEAPGIEATIPDGTLVRLRFLQDTAAGCATSLLIENLASLDGSPNPTTSEDVVWLAAADGASVDAPFEVLTGNAGCTAPGECGAEPVATSFLQFYVPLSEQPGISVPMGGEAAFTDLPGLAGRGHRVRNLRSYDEPACASPTPDVAWWLKLDPL